MESNLQRERGSRLIDWDIMLAQVPKLVRENDGFVESFPASLVALVLDEMEI